MKETIDKLDFIKVKNSRSEKDNVKKMRKTATDWGGGDCENIKNCYSKKQRMYKTTPPQEKTNIWI